MNYFIGLHLLKNKDYDIYKIIKFIKNKISDNSNIPIFNSINNYIIGTFHNIHFEEDNIIIHIEPYLNCMDIDSNKEINYTFDEETEEFTFFI